MSDAIKDGGPAYPSTTQSTRGMSLRDHFAGLALAGELASQDKSSFYSQGDEGNLAAWVYQMADAMIRARDKEPS